MFLAHLAANIQARNEADTIHQKLSAPKLVAIIMGWRRREKLVSDTARAMMNQWVTFILFLLTSKISNTKRLATIDTTTENTKVTQFGLGVEDPAEATLPVEGRRRNHLKQPKIQAGKPAISNHHKN